MRKVRLVLEWFLNPDHVPFVMGQRLGWFAEEGIELEMIEPAEHLDAAELLERGEAEVAITEPLHLVADVAAGKDQVGFARFLHTNGGVMYLGGRGIERPRDLAGRRVQYPGAPGPGGRAIVATMVEADGGAYDPEAIIPVNNGFYHTNALAEDKADCATLAFYNFELVEARHRGLDARFFALKDWGVPDFCQLILIASGEAFERDKAMYASLVKVVRRAIDQIKQSPDEALRIYREHVGLADDDVLSASIYTATTACFTHDLSMSSEYYKNLSAWMRRTGQIEADGDSCWSNTLALG
jgi:ABC-type nitrate/sulfonate/bicarbonate transport system substrate-binding protein